MGEGLPDLDALAATHLQSGGDLFMLQAHLGHRTPALLDDVARRRHRRALEGEPGGQKDTVGGGASGLDIFTE